MNKRMSTAIVKTCEEILPRAAVSAVCPFFLLSILLTASAVSAGGVFSWGVVTPSGISAQTSSGPPLRVTREHPLTVFYSFVVKEEVSKVRFAVSWNDRDEGVTLLEQTVDVKGNVAASHLVLNIHQGVPLGRHDLCIQAFDAIKKVKIQTGKIPYILLPADSECMCQTAPVRNKSENTTQGGREHA
jgi:hypothetical protein